MQGAARISFPRAWKVALPEGRVEDGPNRWRAVHVANGARLSGLALETGERGARHHAVSVEGVPLKDTAAAIGRVLTSPSFPKPLRKLRPISAGTGCWRAKTKPAERLWPFRRFVKSDQIVSIRTCS